MMSSTEFELSLRISAASALNGPLTQRTQRYAESRRDKFNFRALSMMRFAVVCFFVTDILPPE